MVDKVAFLGCGSWGAALGSLLAKKGIQVNFWHRDANIIKGMAKSQEHYLMPSVKFPNTVLFFSNLEEAVKSIETYIIAVPSQNVREIISKVQPQISKSTCIINIAKGIENHTLMTMSEVINDVLGNKGNIVTLSGPSHAEEVIDNQPTAIVSA